MKKIIILLNMLCMGIMGSLAQTTDISQFDQVIYIEPMTVSAGQEATLSVKMKNGDFQATGFQVDILLPEGMSFVEEDGIYDAELSLERTTTAKTNYFDCAMSIDNAGALRLLCNSTKGYAFGGSDGEVAKVKINVASDMEDGTYEIRLLKEVISEATGFSGVNVASPIVCGITVGEAAPSYADGYSLQITPSVMEIDGDLTASVTMENAEAVKSIEFDMELPEGLYIDGEDGEYFVDLGSRVTSSTVKKQFSGVVEEISKGIYHVSASFKRTTSSYIFTGYSGEALSFPMYADGMEEGIYELKIKNVVLNGELAVAPNTTNIFVGNPTVKSTDVLSGDYSSSEAYDILSAALPTADNTVTSINLTGVTALPANTSITLANPNALILTSKDLGLNNDQNVVIGDECAKFVISDGYPFNAPKSFTAADASYSRAMSNKYGTIVLPYAVESSATVQYYVLSDATVSGAEGTLIFTPVSSVAANQPALFQYTDGGEAEMVSMSAEVAATPSELIDILDGTDLQGSWAMLGSFEQQDVASPTVEGMTAYYIKNDTFWQANKSISVKPFRSYFLNGTTMQKTSYRIISDATGIDDITDQLNADDAVSYDLGGRQVETSEKNQVIVTNGSKTIIR